MNKYLAIAACSLPMALAPLVYAQTSATPGAGTGDATAQGGATTPAPSTPAAPMPAPSTGTPPAGTPGSDMPGADKGASASATKTEAITGWSVKKKIMGKAVYNEKNEKVGDVNDVVLASDGKAAYFLVGAGGFLGMGEHDVAIPFQEITQMDDKLILQGYTKEQLKALPKVQVAD
ncbi:PRC-barrel domain containing protein [Parapusillimonas sp. SGNA-6]|nr:PRC-barrel domain containing protein [Parapusillimonas sp. SGNA-6]